MVASTPTPMVLRETAGLFVTGVTVITARAPGDDEVRGMTANGFMSVSLEPPLIVVSIAAAARLHDVVRRAGRYGVTLLGTDLEREARRFAGQPLAGRSSPVDFEDHGGVPVLARGLAWMAADVTDAHAAGDHTLFVAEVRDMAVERPEQPPLAFHRSLFGEVSPLPRVTPLPLDAWSASRDCWG